MLSFFIDRNKIILRVREMVNGKRITLSYSPGLSSEGFIKERQRFEDKYIKENLTLLKVEKCARNIISQYGVSNITNETFRSLISNMLGNGINSFFGFADKWYQEMIDKKGFEWAKQIGTCINKLRDFEPNTNFEGINKKYYNSLITYLEKKHYALNTVGSIIKNLKRICKAASEAGINRNLDYLSFKKPSEDVENIYLSEDEITLIHDLKLTHEFVKEKLKVLDVKKKITALEKARKLFIIGCWTGLRVGNYKRIDPSQIEGDYLNVIAIKGGEKLKIPLHWMVKEIQGSGWPGPMHDQKINIQIKDLGKLAGINTPIISHKTVGGKREEYSKPKYELICTHTARRSFASNMILRGVPKQYIMAITGHKTERDFNRYTAAVQQDQLTAKIAEYGVWK